jgi:hypothetical protein
MRFFYIMRRNRLQKMISSRLKAICSGTEKKLKGKIVIRSASGIIPEEFWGW